MVMILLLVIPNIVYSQFKELGHTKYDIISSHGNDYKIGHTKDNTEYIYYEKPKHSEASGYYSAVETYYFNYGVCDMVVIIEPSTEANGWVSVLNSSLVHIKDMLWKDYDTNTLVAVKIDYVGEIKSVEIIINHSN
jgi:hypothetical protein